MAKRVKFHKEYDPFERNSTQNLFYAEGREVQIHKHHEMICQSSFQKIKMNILEKVLKPNGSSTFGLISRLERKLNLIKLKPQMKYITIHST